MQKVLLFSLLSIGLLIAACDKSTTFPPYVPPVATNFSAKTLNHTKDSVAVGDTLYLTATGILSDTNQAIYTYLISSYTAATYNYGSAATPVKLSRTITSSASNLPGTYTWTSTIMLPGATLVPHKTKLTIVANYIYQLSLSSQQGTVTSTDAGSGPNNKTVYVK